MARASTATQDPQESEAAGPGAMQPPPGWPRSFLPLKSLVCWILRLPGLCSEAVALVKFPFWQEPGDANPQSHQWVNQEAWNTNVMSGGAAAIMQP